MSELSEHDRATLRHIEEQLAQDDPRLTRLLAHFGRRSKFRMPTGMLLAGIVSAVALLLIIPLAVVFSH